MVSKNIESPKDIIEARIDAQGYAIEKELLRRVDLTDAAKQAAEIAAQFVNEGVGALKAAANTYRNVAKALDDAQDPDGAKAALTLAVAIENRIGLLPPETEEDGSNNVNGTWSPGS